MKSTPDDPRVAGQVDPAKRDALDGVTQVVCADLTDCYKQHEASGQMDAQVTVDLAADGKLGGARLSRGTPPEAVKKCLLDAVNSRTPPAGGLGAGQVVCEFSGTFTASTQMLAQDARFVAAKAKP